MIQSMTGYGKAEARLSAGKLTLEIRTLNGKSADITIKTPLLPKERELEVRSRLAAALTRGTIDLFATWEPAAGESGRSLNEPLLHGYFDEIKRISKDAGISIHPTADPLPSAVLMSALLRLPDVVEAKKSDVITEAEWPLVSAAVDKAIAAVNAFRDREGAVLYEDVTSRVHTILGFYDEIECLESERIDTVRARLRKNLDELAAKIDPSRFEQEMIFYLEKLDINEEKVRLREHCRYFLEIIASDPHPGKKLGFIIQEMGREINTTGSKANHAGIQKLVVRAKDELEKIREQSMNIL
ncbi:MAG: YicC family protein [Bacteroidales bacterium]|nr:YicC family protein [Bacteroidales bacterium]